MTAPSEDHPRRHSRVLRTLALEREVGRLLDEGRHELAVLIAQTLLELRVEAELTEYFDAAPDRPLAEAALDLLPSYNLGNPRVQRFVEQLLRVRLRDEHAGVLAALRAHVERRNRIAHHGDQVTVEEARASLSAVKAAVRLVHELTYRALGLDIQLEEEELEREEAGDDWLW